MSRNGHTAPANSRNNQSQVLQQLGAIPHQQFLQAACVQFTHIKKMVMQLHAGGQPNTCFRADLVLWSPWKQRV